MFTDLLPMVCVSIGPLTVSVSGYVIASVCHCVCVCVFVLGAVVLSVQDAEMFADLLPMACVSIGHLTVCV